MATAGHSAAVPAERPTVRRLMITKLVLENFKSYAGVQSIGPFHKKFSAIVGPNGSGKSNVIDAMLFVFGKKAKQIRLDKIASLVHKSDTHPNLREGKVTVYFQEIIDYEDADDEFEMVLGTELTVARTANTSGTSAYYVNNRKSTYQEVTTLLKGKGIDLDHNRFLILQGEVEQISLMKPKGVGENEDGLLEYIEDCIGTQHYKPKIEEVSAVVDQLTEERDTHVNRVQTAEKDRDALEGAKREAEEYLRQEVRLYKNRGAFIQMKIGERKGELASRAKELEALQKTLDAERAKTATCKDQLATLEVEYNTGKRGCNAATKAFERAQEEYRKLDTEAAERTQNRTHAKQGWEKLKTQHQKAQAEVTKTEGQIKNGEKELKVGRAELETLRTRVEADAKEVEEKNDAYRQQLKPLREKLNKLQAEIIPFNETLAREQERLALLEAERKGESGAGEELAKKLSGEQRRRAEYGAKVATLRDGLVKDKKNLKDVQGKHDAELQKLTRSEKALPAVRQQENKLLASVEELKKQAQEVGSEGNIAKALKRLKQQGDLDGYYGRLGDLGTIDDKYSLAIATAAGGFLSCSVVDNQATGKKILNYLKEQQIGRTSVVLLDKQVEQFGRRVHDAYHAPGGLLRLFDLIKPSDAVFAPAFYNAVRDTLVAKDIEEATKIAYSAPKGQPRPRVVTLAGELIEPTGTISGGGKVTHKEGQGMKSYRVSSDSQESLEKQQLQEQKKLEQVHSDAKTLETTILKLKENVNRYSHELKELSTLIRAKEGEIKQIESSLVDIDTAIAALEAKVAEEAERQKVHAARMKQIDAEIKAAQEDVEKALFAKKDRDDQVALLQKEIDDVGGNDFAQLKVALKSNKDRIRELEKKVNTADAAVRAGQKSIVNRRAKLEQLEEDAKKAKEKYQSLEEEDENEDDARSEAKEKVQGIKKEIDKAKVELAMLEKKKDKMKAALNQLKQDEVKLVHDHKAKKNERDTIESQIAKLTETLDQIDVSIRKHVDEFGTCILDPADVEDPATFASADFTVKMKREEWEALDVSAVRREIQKIEELLKSVKPNVKALAEWNEKNEVLLQRSKELKDVSDRRAAAQTRAELLRKARHDEFMTGFKGITHKLKEMYQMLTLGGDAELELVDSFDPFTEGLQFCVRPPKKSWKHISNLSGGEKTLSSLALVFALHHFKPSPLYVMDEIDAALDFKNVSIVANYVKSSARNAQFIIISLRNNMFDLANRWMGIYKTDNCTKSAALQPFIEPTRAAAAATASTPAVGQKRGPPAVEGSPTKRPRMEVP